MVEPYRAPMTPEPDPYLAAWADLRLRRRVATLMVAIGTPLSASATALGGLPAFVVVLPLMAAAGAAALWRSTFLCPRCGHFFGNGHGAGRVAGGGSCCSHCLITEGTPRSAAGPWPLA